MCTCVHNSNQSTSLLGGQHRNHKLSSFAPHVSHSEYADGASFCTRQLSLPRCHFCPFAACRRLSYASRSSRYNQCMFGMPQRQQHTGGGSSGSGGGGKVCLFALHVTRRATAYRFGSSCTHSIECNRNDDVNDDDDRHHLFTTGSI